MAKNKNWVITSSGIKIILPVGYYFGDNAEVKISGFYKEQKEIKEKLKC